MPSNAARASAIAVARERLPGSVWGRNSELGAELVLRGILRYQATWRVSVYLSRVDLGFMKYE